MDGDLLPSEKLQLFSNFVSDCGGVPMLSTAAFAIIITILCTIFNITNLHLKGVFFYIFHTKISRKPWKNNFLRNWVQYYFLDVSIGELFVYGCFILLNVIWFIFRLEIGQNVEKFFVFDIHGLNLAFGRLALLDTLFVLFPAHRISVLQLVFGIGMDELLKYHKMLGLKLMISTLLHFLFVFIEGIQNGTFEKITGWQKRDWGDRPLFEQDLAGTIAAIALLFMLILSLEAVRKAWYTFFWYCHMIASLAFFAFLVMHRNETTLGILSISIAFTVIDFGYRFISGFFVPCKIDSVEVFEKLELFKVGIKKQYFPKFYTSQHVYIWTKDCFLLAHPFSIASTSKEDVLMIYIKARGVGGYTRKLYDLARSDPEKFKRTFIRITGPYGTPFLYDKPFYDHIFLIVDGVTGTGVVMGMLKDIYLKKRDIKVTFFFLIRDFAYFEVFKEELDLLYPKGDTHIYFVGKRRKIQYNHDKTQMDISMEEFTKYEQDKKKRCNSNNPYLNKYSLFSPNFQKEIAKVPGKRVGFCVFGSERLVNHIKTAASNTKKTCQFFEPVYQM